jgi:hypothetical protein
VTGAELKAIKRAWLRAGKGEYRAAYDHIAGRVQLEQKQVAELERAKVCC